MRISISRRSSREGVGIRGLSIVDGRVAWASGSKGSFAKTTDGGATWEWSAVPGYEALDFRAVKAFSDASAVIMSAGAPATILTTSDGGSTWKESFSDPSGAMFFDAMAFWDERSGIVLGDPLDDGCCLLATDDAGASWSHLPPSSLPEMLPGESHFAASGTCLAASGHADLCFVSGGSAARAFFSADRGKTWRVSGLPLMSGKPSQGAFSIAITGGANACVVGGDYAEPGLAYGSAAVSSDGGRSWAAADAPPPGGYNSCVAYLPGLAGEALFATGTEGSHLSEDGGRTWALVDAESYNVAAFEPGGERGWAAGADGRISEIRIA